jgi:type IV pilus assembly protein PilV
MSHRPVTTISRRGRMRAVPYAKTAQAGVGLIEVLVAVLVLSIAFLGMAILQATSLSTNNSAMARSNATILAYSIQDAMRVDRANAISGVYNKTVTANSCPATDGTLAGYQLNAWCTALGVSLGSQSTTSGTVNCSASGCKVTVQFDDSRSGTGGASAQQVITTDML